jgi:hypothetical protein
MDKFSGHPGLFDLKFTRLASVETSNDHARVNLGQPGRPMG